MSFRPGSSIATRWGIVIALVLTIASGFAYPGGTVRDESTRGYSFAHNFLSDLGATVAFNYQRNLTGAVLFGVSVLIMVLVLAGSIITTVRLLSATPSSRAFAYLAAAAGVLVCIGFVGAALTPEDRAWNLHMLSSKVAFRSFPVATALLAVATLRDHRFRSRATVGWVILTVVLAGLIAIVHLGPSPATENGLVTQVITQKIMAATVVVVLWIESREAELVARFGIEPLA